MTLSKKQKHWLIITGIIVGILVVIIIAIDIILATIIRGKIDQALNKNTTDYQVSIKRVGVNILTGNLNVRGLKIVPDSALINGVKKGTVNLKFIQASEIGLFRIAGVNIYKALMDGEIYARKILFKEAKIKIYKGKIPPKGIEVEDKSQNKFNPDSIAIKGLHKINLHEIDFVDCKVEVFEISENEKDKKLFSTGDLDLYLHSVDFVKHPDNPDVFRLDFSKFKAELSVTSLLLPGGWYFMDIDRLIYNNANDFLEINGLAMHPTYQDKYKMAKAFKFTKEIYDLDVNKIYVESFNVFEILSKNEVIIDSVGVDGLKVEILKDKRYPFDESRRPKLPHQLLKNMKFPLYIRKIAIQNSDLVYQEKMKDIKPLMTVQLGSLNVMIDNVTSIKDSIRKVKMMKARLKGKLMRKVPLTIDFVFPLNIRKDTFYLAGSMGAAPLSTFNPAAFPAIGAKFEKGKLKSVTFKGGANDSVSSGQMTLLYSDLSVSILQKDRIKKNKFMSWAASSVSRTGNPGKNGTTRIAVMGFKRVMYKGFGNFMWKTLQTGIVNSISPFGKTLKTQKSPKTQKQKSTKQTQQKTNQTKSKGTQKQKSSGNQKQKKQNKKKNK